MHESNWKNPAYIYAHLYGVHICGLCCITSPDLLYLVMECITINDSPCVRMKCCSNTSPHVQFIHVKTHYLTIEHKIHGQQHSNAHA